MPRAGLWPLIAIVDDDEEFQRSISRLLKASGFRVETFESAEAFLESGDIGGTSCAVLDMRLPGMSGLELQRQLNTAERPPSIVFVSAHDQPAVRARALRAGAIAFLRKPFDDTALIDAIETALGTS